MKLRPAAIALALAAVVGLLLSGCGPAKTGSAAIVGDTSITMKDVDDYVFALNEDQLAHSNFSTTEAQMAAGRALVLRFSVTAAVTTQALEKLGLDPTPGELQAARNKGITLIAGTPPQGLSDEEVDAVLLANLEGFGVKAAFLDTVLLVAEQFGILADELNVTSVRAIGSAIADMGIDVRVNPRFGSWSFQDMDVTPGPSVPSFLQPTSASESETPAS